MMALSILISTTGVSAAPICPPSKSLIADKVDVAALVLKVEQVGEPDRKDAKTFAKDNKESESDILQRYAGSGDLNCGDGFAQAQVVLKNNVIVTSAHALISEKGCPNSIKPITSCSFLATVGGQVKKYEVERVLDTGRKCPYEGKFPRSTDWITLRLKESVDPRIKPYRISAKDPSRYGQNAEVVQVAKSDDIGIKGAKTMIQAKRHYGNCRIQHAYGEAPVRQVETDCDSSPGSSGGGLFTPDKDPVLLGIVSGMYGGCPDGTGKSGKGNYQRGCWAGIVTPLDGDLRSSLESLDESRPVQRAVPPPETGGFNVPSKTDQRPYQRSF